MVELAFAFLVTGLLAGLLGFTGAATFAAGAAKLVFVLCLIVFVVLLVLALLLPR